MNEITQESKAELETPIATVVPVPMATRLREFRDRGIMALDIPNNGISDAGMKAIALHLMDWLSVRAPDKVMPNPLLYFDVQHEWLVTDKKAMYQGTFPKRLAKAFKRQMGLDLDSMIMGRIGDTARQYCPKSKTYHVDFTQSFNWRAGDFGDYGSCFWSERKEARTMMHEEGFWAMRFYEHSSENGGDLTGSARCWLKPLKDGAIIFNAYPTSMSIQVMARVLAFLTGNSYVKIPSLCNHGDECGTLYINGGKGQYIGPNNLLELYAESYDFKIDEPTKGSPCYNCGVDVDEDNECLVGDDPYCQECFDKLFTSCDSCDEIVRKRDAKLVNGSWVCDDCIRDKYVKCVQCDDYIDTNRGDYNIVDDDVYCQTCYEEQCARCPDCDDDHDVSNMTEASDESGTWYCEDCVDDHTCIRCQEVVTELEEGHDGKLRCLSCHEEWIAENPAPKPDDSKLAPTPLDSDTVKSLMLPDGACPCSVCINTITTPCPHMNSYSIAESLYIQLLKEEVPV